MSSATLASDIHPSPVRVRVIVVSDAGSSAFDTTLAMALDPAARPLRSLEA
jgi:hypothetical protein